MKKVLSAVDERAGSISTPSISIAKEAEQNRTKARARRKDSRAQKSY
jgi:hypothetical protein